MPPQPLLPNVRILRMMRWRSFGVASYLLGYKPLAKVPLTIIPSSQLYSSHIHRSQLAMASTVPFVSRIASRSGKEIIARDIARARKIMAGMNPHGPAAFHEARRRRHHGHHGHHGGGSTTDPSGGSGTPPSGGSGPTPGGGVDVTDAGVTYTASVGVGNPATQYTLLIDTGRNSMSS